MNDTINAKNVGNNILRFRQNKEMSQSELAGLLCVSRTVVSRWETGDRLPETQMLPRICKVFDVSLEELLYDYNEDAKDAKEPENEIENSKILYGFTKWPGISWEKLSDTLNSTLSGNQIENEIYVAFYFFTFPVKTISAMFNIKANEIYSYISIVNKKVFDALREDENADINKNITKNEFIAAISNIKNIDFGKIILKKTETDSVANHKKTILIPTAISIIVLALTGLSLSYFMTRPNGRSGMGIIPKTTNNLIVIKTSPEEKNEPTATVLPDKKYASEILNNDIAIYYSTSGALEQNDETIFSDCKAFGEYYVNERYINENVEKVINVNYLGMQISAEYKHTLRWNEGEYLEYMTSDRSIQLRKNEAGRIVFYHNYRIDREYNYIDKNKCYELARKYLVELYGENVDLFSDCYEEETDCGIRLGFGIEKDGVQISSVFIELDENCELVHFEEVRRQNYEYFINEGIDDLSLYIKMGDQKFEETVLKKSSDITVKETVYQFWMEGGKEPFLRCDYMISQGKNIYTTRIMVLVPIK